jgi:prespore-specific regulator
MKVRQDAWTDENDLLLAETVLRHVREGSTQLNAFEEVGDKLNRTSAACGFRWNAVVRHRYEKALQLAKKQRKQRQRILGKDQGGKKKLLYSPPVPTLEEVGPIATAEVEAYEAYEVPNFSEEMAEEPAAVTTSVIQAALPSPAFSPQMQAPREMNMETVISYLRSLGGSNIQVDILKNENERLKREMASLKRRNEELEGKIQHLEQNTEIIQEDYETLMKIMNRARKLVVLEEEEDRPATKFKMDRNGNLEKIAE